MKAIVYTKFGPPDVLQVREVEKPTPGDNELLIRVRAAEVTKADCEMRSFRFPVKWTWLPMRLIMGFTRPRKQVLGGYFAGEVKAVGKGVSKHNVGDAVFGTAGIRFGAHSEYLCLPASNTTVLKPRNLSFEEAAAVPLGALNALHFMRKAEIREGETVLINGAGGSIGTFGVQFARAMGAGEVTVVDSAIKENMLRRIGADQFIDYTTSDFTRMGRTYDVIFNMVAGISFSDCIRVLNPNGRYVMANPRLSDMLRSARLSRSSDKKAIFAFAAEREDELLAIKEMIERDEVKPVLDRVYPLEQAADAHRRVEAEQRLGAVVLSTDVQAPSTPHGSAA